MEIVDQRRAALLAYGEAFVPRQADDPALDVEQGVEPLYRFERDRIDEPRTLAAALPARGALDVGQLEELAPGVGEAAGLEHGARLASVAVELSIAAIGVRLQDPGPGGEMGPRMFAPSIA